MDGSIAAAQDFVATIAVPSQLDDPAKADLAMALDQAGEDDAVRVILLIADGDSFGFGEPEPLEMSLVERSTDRLLDPWKALRRLRKPVIAALKGRVENASAALALGCDLRLGDDSMALRFDAVERGTGQLRGVAPLLTRIAGPAHAADMLLTAKTVGADEALSIGILSRLVPPDQLADTARELACKLAMAAPLALQYAKEAIVEGCDLPVEAGCRLEHDLYLLLQTTQDRAEGLAAFFAKRPPVFRGE